MPEVNKLDKNKKKAVRNELLKIHFVTASAEMLFLDELANIGITENTIFYKL